MKTMQWKMMGMVLFAAFLLQACGAGFGGNSGNFVFYDRTPNTSLDSGTQHPLALGAQMTFRVSGPEALADVISSDPEVVEVLNFGGNEEEGLLIALRGVAPGTARITAQATDGSEDSVDVEVRNIHSAEIKLVPWVSIVSLPEALWENGAAMLPGASVRVSVLLRGESGELLTGSGAAQWSVSEGAPGSVMADDGDYATLRAGEETGEIELRFGEWAVTRVEVVEASAITEVGLYSQSEDVRSEPGAPMTLAQDRSHLMHVTAYTASGQYVIGAGPEPVDPEAQEAAPFHVSIDAGSVQEGEQGEDEAALARILSNGRAFFLDTGGAGEGVLRIDWLGETQSFDIQVR